VSGSESSTTSFSSSTASHTPILSLSNLPYSCCIRRAKLCVCGKGGRCQDARLLMQATAAGHTTAGTCGRKRHAVGEK
jgi:hypothetical protein